MFTRKTWTRVAIALIIVIVLFFVYRKFTKKSEYVFPPTATSDTLTARQTAYSSNIDTCETIYINAMNAAGADQVAKDAAMNTANTCISSNVIAYYNARCPFLPGADGTSAAITATGPGAPVGGTSNTAYQAYLADITVINNAYTDIIRQVNETMSINIIQAARKADFTGASRKYFATLCPDLYSNTTSTALTTQYLAWTSAATASTAYGFQASRVTKDRIWQWAIHAGAAPGTTGDTYTAPTVPLISTTTTLALCANSDYNVATLNGTTPNWQIAADNGPGTLNTSVTFPWNTASTTICAPGSGTYIAGASAANPLP
jgi:hypothetical protein